MPLLSQYDRVRPFLRGKYCYAVLMLLAKQGQTRLYSDNESILTV